MLSGGVPLNKEMMTNLKEYYDQKALDILLHMTLEEKVDLMGGEISMFRLVWDMMVNGHYNPVPYPAGGHSTLGVPPLMFCDGPRGLVPGKRYLFPSCNGSWRQL